MRVQNFVTESGHLGSALVEMIVRLGTLTVQRLYDRENQLLLLLLSILLAQTFDVLTVDDCVELQVESAVGQRRHCSVRQSSAGPVKMRHLHALAIFEKCAQGLSGHCVTCIRKGRAGGRNAALHQSVAQNTSYCATMVNGRLALVIRQRPYPPPHCDRPSRLLTTLMIP